MARKQNRVKKTAVEAQAYRKSITKSETGLYDNAETYNIDSPYLTGSNEKTDSYNSLNSKDTSTPVADKPLKYKIADAIKNNTGAALVVTILVAVLSFLLTTTITHMVTIGRLEERINEAEEAIKDLDESKEDSKYIESEIQHLRDDMDDLDVDKINEKLDQLEVDIRILEQAEEGTH